MPPATHRYVFTYDIERDGTRAKVAALLENDLVRVQKSVFEGRMTMRQAMRLAERIGAISAPADSLRVYALTAERLGASFARGTRHLAKSPLFSCSDMWLPCPAAAQFPAVTLPDIVQMWTHDDAVAICRRPTDLEDHPDLALRSSRFADRR